MAVALLTSCPRKYDQVLGKVSVLALVLGKVLVLTVVFQPFFYPPIFIYVNTSKNTSPAIKVHILRQLKIGISFAHLPPGDC